MGLDISAYSNVKCLREDSETLNCNWGKEFILFINPHFPERCMNFKNGIYSFEEEKDFGCGSYGSYNGWRSELAMLAGYWEKDSGSFWELINFSDCEGCIDFEVSKKLYTDFCDFDEKAKIYDVDKNSYFYLHHIDRGKMLLN